MFGGNVNQGAVETLMMLKTKIVNRQQIKGRIASWLKLNSAKSAGHGADASALSQIQIAEDHLWRFETI